mmetsp:Transcript_90041/g.250109  ORF Transcript_90041/g.250109 Transcript_90041/m.250109 type:complete len:269 (+) Transcript_90041:1758-2564(+)
MAVHCTHRCDTRQLLRGIVDHLVATQTVQPAGACVLKIAVAIDTAARLHGGRHDGVGAIGSAGGLTEERVHAGRRHELVIRSADFHQAHVVDNALGVLAGQGPGQLHGAGEAAPPDRPAAERREELRVIAQDQRLHLPMQALELIRGTLRQEGALGDAVFAEPEALAKEVAVQVGLGVHVVHVDVDPHGINHVLAAPQLDVGALGLVQEAREDAGKVHDVLVAVRRDVRAVRVALHGTVRVQLVQADGEELHDLPRVVLVREPAVEVE